MEFDREELEAHMGRGRNGLIGKQLKATARVEDWFFGTAAAGNAATRVFSDNVVLTFLGGEVWSFKPNIPFKIYVSELLHLKLQLKLAVSAHG